MARHEFRFEADGDEPLGLRELLALFRPEDSGPAALENARACYFSSGEGWREAVKKLDGAFASEARVADKAEQK